MGDSSRGVIQKRGERKKKRKWKKRTQERLFDRFPLLSTSSYTLQFEQDLPTSETQQKCEKPD